MKMAFSIHPFLLAVYPLLFLYSNNLTAVSVTDFLLPLMLLLLFPALLWFLVSLVLKDNRKGGLIVSLFLFFFFSFGYFSRIMVPPLYQIIGSTIGPRTLFSILWGLLFMGSIYFLRKADKGLDQLNTFLNFFSAFMIILIVITIGFRQARMGFFSRDTQEVIESPAGAMSWKDRQNLPNIFFIILDGYGRTDVLKERFQFDNKDLIDYLKHKGFFVAQKSHSNYCQTLLTLASILNLKYLNEQDGLNPQANSHFPLIGMIKKNQVVRLLKQYGYISVALIPDQSDLEFLNFDITIRNRFGLNEFQSALLEITPLYLLLNKFSKKLNPFQNHRKRILAMFDQFGGRYQGGSTPRPSSMPIF